MSDARWPRRARRGRRNQRRAPWCSKSRGQIHGGEGTITGFVR
jgi:hypothetical protein